ncbi:MAG: monovalent cation/H+ antiporter complex subunit F [Pseudomonadota bacterium]|nr:MAG: cation:proton antiporter [Pseudomonadota bacterium]
MLSIVMQIVQVLLGAALILAFVRLSRGPSLQDRIVAMDLIAVLTVGMIVAATAGTGQRGLLDAAILITLVGFLGTVAYAWYVQREGQR